MNTQIRENKIEALTVEIESKLKELVDLMTPTRLEMYMDHLKDKGRLWTKNYPGRNG